MVWSAAFLGISPIEFFETQVSFEAMSSIGSDFPTGRFSTLPILQSSFLFSLWQFSLGAEVRIAASKIQSRNLASKDERIFKPDEKFGDT